MKNREMTLTKNTDKAVMLKTNKSKVEIKQVGNSTMYFNTNGVSGPVRCWCLKSTGFSCSHRSEAAFKLRNPVRFEHQKVVRVEARTAYVGGGRH